MKKSRNRIDDTFKQLENDIFQVTDSFLEDLNQRLDEYIPEKKKRRGGFFWTLLSGIMLLGIIGVNHFFSSKTTNNETAISIEIKNKNLEEKSSSINQDGNQNESANIANAIDSNNKKINNSSLSDDKNNITKKSRDLHIIRTSSATHESKTKSFATIDKTLKSRENKQTIDGSRKQKLKKPNNGLVSENLGNDLPLLNNADNSASTRLTEQSSLLASGIKTKKTETNSSNDSETNKLSSDNNSKQLQLNARALVFPEKNLSLERQAEPIIVNEDLGSASSKKVLSYDIQLYGGISQTFWKMKLTDNFVMNEFDRTLIFSPAFGLTGNTFYKNWNASVGLEYYQSNQKLKFTTKSLQQTGVDSMSIGFQIDTIFIDSVTWYYDSTEVFQYIMLFDSITDVKNQINNYTWLSIPISFGYRFNYHSWSFIPRAGVSLNFGISENRGSYPSSGFNLQEHEAVRFNADIMIQTEIRKNFNTFHIFLTPYYRGNLSPMLKATNFTISHQSWGVNFGLGIDL